MWRSAVAKWLANSTAGSCGVTSGQGDCESGSHGAFQLAPVEFRSWESAVHACLLRCEACSRCRYITISVKASDCSWYSACDLGSLPLLPREVTHWYPPNAFASGSASRLHHNQRLARGRPSGTCSPRARTSVARPQCTCEDLPETLNRLDEHLRAEGFDSTDNGAHDDSKGVEGSSTLEETTYLCALARNASRKRQRGSLHVCQTGFNRARSAVAFLSASPRVRLSSFDLGEHSYVRFAASWIANEFGEKAHQLRLGDSTKSLPEAIKAGELRPGCDLLFVDGGHVTDVAFADTVNFGRAATPGALLLMDDCPSMMGHAFQSLCDQAVLRCEGSQPKWRGTTGSSKAICMAPYLQASQEQPPSEALWEEAHKLVVGGKGGGSGSGAVGDHGVGVCGWSAEYSDCSHGEMGMWRLRAGSTLESCTARCLQCERCRFISFSKERSDCSWFSRCNLQQLEHMGGAGSSYTSLRVKA